MPSKEKNKTKNNFFHFLLEREGFFALVSLLLTVLLVGSFFCIYSGLLFKSAQTNSLLNKQDTTLPTAPDGSQTYQSLLDNTIRSIKQSEQILVNRENVLREEMRRHRP